MLTQLEQELLAALKLARGEISGMSQHYGEGPPEADHDRMVVIHAAYERAERIRLQIPEILPLSDAAVVISSWEGHDFEVYQQDGHARGRIVKVQRKRRPMIYDGSLFHDAIDEWEALKERGHWLHR